MNCREAIARPGTAAISLQAVSFSFSPEAEDPLTVFWDVTAIAEYLVEKRAEPSWMPLRGLESWLEEGRIEIDRVHAMSSRVDPSVPILAIQFDDGSLPVDGWHRVFQALKRGWTTIPALFLDGEEEYRFRYPQAVCDRLRDLSRNPAFRLLAQQLEKALRPDRPIFGARV